MKGTSTNQNKAKWVYYNYRIVTTMFRVKKSNTILLFVFEQTKPNFKYNNYNNKNDNKELAWMCFRKANFLFLNLIVCTHEKN